MRLKRSVPAVILLAFSCISKAEVSLDALYDFRHTVDPKNNPRNFPVLRLNVFSQKSYGDFFLSDEVELNGEKNNSSKNYIQISQSFRLGNATLHGLPVFAHAGYSSGLGVYGNADGGYYIDSKYKVGLDYPFHVGEAFCSLELTAAYTNTPKPRLDPLVSFYAGRFFLNYRLVLSSTLQVWTAEKYRSDAVRLVGDGTYYAWNIETNLWYEIAKPFSVGTFIRTSRNVQDTKGEWTIYPSVGIRYAF